MFSERLSRFIKSIGETPSSFERIIGVSKGAISKPIKNGRTVGVEILEKIFSLYPDLSADWLVAGSGDMSKKEAAANGTDPGMAHDQGVEYRFMKGPKARVALIDETKAAGWDGTGEGGPIDFVFYLPASWLPRRQGYAAFSLTNDSMDPAFPLKSYAIAELVRPEEYQGIRNGAVCAVITSDRVMVRRITNRLKEKGVLHAAADNREYASCDVAEDEIASVWKVKAIFSPYAGSDPHQLFHLYRDLEERIRQLEGKRAHD